MLHIVGTEQQTDCLTTVLNSLFCLNFAANVSFTAVSPRVFTPTSTGNLYRNKPFKQVNL